MPTCPGCEQTVPYDRLDTHQRYCDGIWGSNALGSRPVDRPDRRLSDLELRLDRQLEHLEEDIERRLTRMEQSLQPTRESFQEE